MYGPLCWQGYDKDPSGFKKTLWYGIMKEFDCKESSTWSACGRGREEAFTHRHLSPEKKEETSQLDYIIGSMRRDDEENIHNDERTWATWDHYTIYARIQEEEQTNNYTKGKRKKKWTAWKPKTDEQTMQFRKEEMEKNEDTEDDLAIIQRNIETAAGQVAHQSRKRNIIMSTPDNVRQREEAAARCTAKIKRQLLKKQARKARAEQPRKKKANKMPLTELHVKGQFTEDREEWQKKPQRHCQEVYTDLEETKEAQE